MDIGVVTIFPSMFGAVEENGISAQAIAKGAMNLALWNPRDFTRDPHRTVDDRPYGGGPGMVMKPEPLALAIDAARRRIEGPVLYLSPQGEKLDQGKMVELASLPGLTLVAGRYEGIDERVVASRVDGELSIGDYVLAGGELAAMVVIEGVARLLPGVLGNDQSASQDSFEDGMLDCPHYTRPEVFEGRTVPPVLLSGDHGKIRHWRRMQALGRTRTRRPDLLEGRDLDEAEINLLKAYQREQHDD